MSPQILARIEFYETSRGGRGTPLIGPWYGPLLELVGDPIYHECRVLLDGVGPVSPGQTVVAPITLWRPDLVISKLCIGETFFLTEGKRRIARGELVEILQNAG